MGLKLNKTGILWAVFILVCIVSILIWQHFQPSKLGSNFASSNGRIEAIEIDIATKIPGRIKNILVDEGDFVRAGQIVANMDTQVLKAQLREAQARFKQVQSSVESAQSQVKQRISEKDAAIAMVAQRDAELALAKNRLERIESLTIQKAASIDTRDETRAHFYSSESALNAAKAQVAAAEAAIATAQALVIGAQSSVEATKATIERLEADIEDSALQAPRDGRIQFRVAQPGEVLSAGGRVVNMVDLTDVYMTFFLPTSDAGKVQIGSQVHLVLDAAPQFVIPAKVTYVASVAQFTPKTVETANERQKLMFRVKAHISPELLKKYIHAVKTGLPGMAYVKLNPKSEWPAELQVKIPND
jgi:HlyD family secretion protein